MENGDAPNADREELLVEKPDSSNTVFSCIPASTTPAMKLSNALEPGSCLGHRYSSDLMAKEAVARKVPRPTSPVPRGYMDPVRILAPNSDTSSQAQSQPRRLSHHVYTESAIKCEDSQALLLGITVDLKGGEYPFFTLLRVREILGRTYKLR